MSIEEQSKQYFDHYPNEDEFLVSSDGQFFLSKDKSLAYSHERSLGKKGKGLKTVKRQEAKGTEKPPVETPEGNPTEKWTIPQIQAWLDERELKYAANAKEANLLGKVEEYLKAGKPE